MDSHHPHYHSTGRSHWCICTCGWRSVLVASKPEIEALFVKHKEESP